MSELEKIFDNYMENKSDSGEVILADEKASEYMELFLNRETLRKIDELIAECNIAYEKQGFLNGFRYAVKLLTCN